MRNKRKLKFPILLAGDLALFYGALFSMLLYRYLPHEIWQEFITHHATPFIIVFALWILTFLSLGLYEVRITKNNYEFAKKLVRATLTNALIGITLFYILPNLKITPRADLLLVLFFTALYIFAWRYIFNNIIARRSADRVLFFGLSEEVSALARYLKANPQYAFQPVVYVTTEKISDQTLFKPLYQFNHNLKELAQKFSIDTVVAAQNMSDDKTLARALFEIMPLGVKFIDFPIFYEMITGKIPVNRIDEIWFLENFVHIKNTLYEKIHRALDIALLLLMAIPAILFAPFIALGIKIDSKGPIFYRQKRIGRRNTEIEIIKFRSMAIDAEKSGALWADEDDPRVTAIGSILRKTRMDELPQLWNIAKGEMSFVGPRPERPEFVKTLANKIPFYQMRHLVTPGLTGWAQINFTYGASVKDAMEKLQYDLYYIKHRSLSLDFDILLRTIVVILSRSGR